MSTAELAAARRAIARLELPVRPIASRRTRIDPRGRLPDWRGTMRAALRSGGDVQALVQRARRTRWPNLVALCDISGSMSSYSRMLLHFLHAAANAKGAGWAQVHAFTFGTRLTNITRHLRQRDVDAALTAAGREALDWEGGTRIGACLHAFNRDWSRRVLSQGGVVLLITDGLDRDDPDRLAYEMERLHLSARRLIWLNPLLRWDGFAPRARGIRAILPHVDSFRACHNLASLEDVSAALSRPDDPGDKTRLLRLLATDLRLRASPGVGGTLTVRARTGVGGLLEEAGDPDGGHRGREGAGDAVAVDRIAALGLLAVAAVDLRGRNQRRQAGPRQRVACQQRGRAAVALDEQLRRADRPGRRSQRQALAAAWSCCAAASRRMPRSPHSARS